MAGRDVRSPQVVVLVNGAPVGGIIDVEVSSNNHLAANRYRLSASLAATGYDVWAAASLTVEVQIGLGGEFRSLTIGDVDRLDFDIGRNEVHVDGRDLTSRLIEARTQESFENQTSSAVATLLATRHGLIPFVSVTPRLIGRDYQNSYSRLTLDQHSRATTEWDLLVRLAEEDGFDVWVEGQALYYAPAQQAGDVLMMTPSDCLSLRLERLPPLSSGLTVTVKSWDGRGQRRILESAQSAATSGASRKYSVVQPNLSSTDARALAARLLSQMAQHERSVAIDMPGDLTTRPRGILELAETNTDFDGVWLITGVERRISSERGFEQTLEARLPPWTVF